METERSERPSTQRRTSEEARQATLSGLSTLHDPVRRRLYDHVAGSDDPVSRDEAARVADIGRTLAAYHLDRLVEAGLLSATYRRPEGRGGPGAGRPAKLYQATETELSLSVPPRDYELLARLLVEAVQHDTTGTMRAALDQTAQTTGERLAGAVGDLTEALARCGYQPSVTDDGGIELRNCPFHALASEHTEVVCGLNLRLLQGMITATGCEALCAELDPRPGRCCVVVRHGQEEHAAAPAGG